MKNLSLKLLTLLCATQAYFNCYSAEPKELVISERKSSKTTTNSEEEKWEEIGGPAAPSTTALLAEILELKASQMNVARNQALLFDLFTAMTKETLRGFESISRKLELMEAGQIALQKNIGKSEEERTLERELSSLFIKGFQTAGNRMAAIEGKINARSLEKVDQATQWEKKDTEEPFPSTILKREEDL